MKTLENRICAILVVLAVITICFSCLDEDSETPEENDGDESSDDDDYREEQRWQRNEEDENDNEDPDPFNKSKPPIIENAVFIPNPVQYDPSENQWLTYLEFEVCDVNNDLLGGRIYMTQAGKESSFLVFDYISIKGRHHPTSDVTDCNNKAEMFAGVIFGEGPDLPALNKEFCADLQIEDNKGNKSNKLTNICVYCR